MNDVVVGIVAVVIGAVFCFRGWQLIRVILPIIGAFAGFVVGASIVASARNEELLGSVFGWVVAIAAAIVLGVLGYFVYAVAVVIGLAGMGFSLAYGALIALGVTWSWAVVAGAVLAAMLVAVVAIMSDVPMILLVILTALAGANAIVTGVMLLVGTMNLREFFSDTAVELVRADWWWYVALGVLAVLGVAAQFSGERRAGQSVN